MVDWTPVPRICHVCENKTITYMSFHQGESTTLVVCFDCLSVGIKWIVNQGRAAEGRLEIGKDE